MNPYQGLLIAVASAAIYCEAQAGVLLWENEKLSLVAQPEQTELTAEFNFKNIAAHRVTIISVKPSCGCMTPSVSKNTLEAGETGRIEVLFKIGDRTGQLEKTIAVITDEPGAEPTQLTLRTKILRYLAVEPNIVFWAVGGDASEQTIMCTAQSDHAISIKGLKCSLPDIVSRIDAIEPGAKYAVRLRSAPRLEHATALIEIAVEVAGVGPKVVQAYAYFR
jgi:hypothetical protein